MTNRILARCWPLAVLALSACATSPTTGRGQVQADETTTVVPAAAEPVDGAQVDGAAATPPQPAAPAAMPAEGSDTPVAAPTTGLAIFESFRDGLAEPQCRDAEPRWRKHFAHAPQRLGAPGGDTLALFGHVVESLRAADLPTEFALIPFVESGYAPGARSRSGPAGLWQFITITGRSHGLRIEKGYDARLSPAESTRAAVSYLEALYRRFDGNWRLTVMAYNAGEFRVLQALRRSGGEVASAAPQNVGGLPQITYAYVEKLHALACLLEQAGTQPQWRAALDRPVTPLRAQPLDDARSLEQWAARNGQDAATLRRLNPALAGHWPSRGTPLALVPATGAGTAGTASAAASPVVAQADAAAATYTVRRGDSASTIARRHGVSTQRLLDLNGLHAKSVLRPGMVLRLD
ncbi:lytic transglycosylase domain-containing protein [Pseudoxanthomonas koreensis]|uniref:lytic transglycosylase domain-containing protein n=1 Tax=Pseudoxanthomonas koreensis TaxID=266061 RepID=UPI001390A206|nr:lytic transglycosylase domain-containing protein [Pseudoxanthomonas koreensis]KAF1695638.1 lytic transglycosylase [Pseudoxanthomonas koreensis]